MQKFNFITGMKPKTFFRYILIILFALIFTGSLLKSQTPLRIMPMGNSITWDEISGDTRPLGDKVAYRYQLYQLLNADGYTYNFIGSENSGGNYLPAGYADNAGFPGITAAQLLTLLQTGRNYYLDPINGFCELPICPQNYLAYYQPDIILLHIGTNGLTDSASAPGKVASISGILDFIDAYETSSGKTIPVFLAQIINRAGSNPSGNHQPTTYFNQLLAAMVATRTSDVIRLVNMESGAGINYRYTPLGDMIDTYHPAPSGYTKMGTKWFNALDSFNYAPPTVSDIPNQTVNEGTSFSTINLNNFVFDPQEADANITWTYTTPVNLNISISPGKIATITVKDSEWNGNETITFRAYDSGNGGTPLFNSDNVTFTVLAVNDVPVLSGIESAPISYTEGQGNVNVTSSILINDVDNTTLTSASVTITGGYLNTEDVLNFTNQSGIAGSWNSSSGILTLSGTATLANYRTALRSISYQNTNINNPSTTPRQVNFTVNDGTDNSNTVSRTINITGVNDAPELNNIEASAISYSEEQSPVNITSTLNVIDVDHPNLVSATIRIASGYVNGQDMLYFTNQNGISSSWNSGNGTMSLSGTSSVINYQTAIRSITYANLNTTNPNTASRTITFVVNDGFSPSNTVQRTLNVIAVNDPPVLGNMETSTISYTEGQGEVNVTTSLTVTDVDNTTLTSASVQITTGYVSTEDILRFTNQSGITGSWSVATGTMSLSGTATPASYQTALRSIRYENTNVSNPSTIGRAVSFRVNDGTDNSNTVSRNISINSTNNPPVLSSIEVTPLSYTEGQAPVSVTSSIIVQDADNINLASATVRFTSGYSSSEDLLNFINQNGITSSWNSTSGILTLSGSSSVANYQAALRSITYSNSNNDNPSTTSRTVTFRVNDGTANSNEVSRSIAVTAVNDAPVLSGIEITSLTYTEEMPPVVITSTIAVADVDNTNLLSASITIAGGYLNTEDVLSFSTQNGITGSWNASAGTMTLSGNSSVTNYQLALRSVRYQNTNTLNPSSTDRTINFTVNDGTTGSNAVTRNISVFPVNDAPLLGNIETTATNYTEQAAPVTITSTLTVTDYDSPTLASATVRITTAYLGTEDILRFSNQNGINGSWDGATGTLNLIGPATLSNYQAALRSVSYENLNTQKPSVLPRTVSFTVNDGFLLSNSVTRNITVTGVNDPPELTGIEPLAINYTEGQLPVKITNTLIVTDVDNDSLVSATIKIADNPVAGEDTLMYPVKIGNITGLYNPATFTMTLSGGDTKLMYRNAIRSILYQNRDTLDPSTMFRTISINVNDGTSPALAPAYRYISIIQVNDPPSAKNVGISGLKTIFTLNTVNYNYVDPENDLEGATVFTWKRSTQPGNDSATIPGATAKTYILQFPDGGRYIKATVKPADIFGAQSAIAYHSPWYYVNAAPEAKNVRLGGIIAVGQTDTVRFDYADKELNPPNTSGHIYMWYRANSLPDTINKTLVATTRTYTLTALDSTRYISFALAPVALAGSLIGDTIQSKWYGPISRLPSATISGNDTLCAGELASVKLALTGTSPWSVTYTINNLNPTVIPSIPTSDYTILTNKAGTYRVTKVSDAKFPDGIVNGTAFVGLHDTVKVTLSALGDTAICDDRVSAATLSANFTGTAPWSFVLSISGADTTYTNVLLDPFSFSSRKPGNYKIKSVSDKFCTSLTGSPKTVTVLYKPSPTATITGLDTICPGDTARLTVILTTGTLPWRFTYTVDSVSPKSTPWITTSGYTLKVLNQGTYRITILSDALCTGKATGQGKVVYRSAPAANLSGGGTVCSGTSAPLRVDLAGTAPWSFSYKRGSAVIDTFKNVIATPRLFTAKTPGTYTLGYVRDKYCKGTVTGSVSVSVIPAPVVKISGLNQTYSINNDPVPVYGSPVGGYFTGQGLIPRNDTMFFLPSWAGVDGSPHKITYTYQDPISGCFGKDTFMVNVLEVEADIIFPDGKDFYCFNDPPFIVTGANIVGDTGTFTISGGVGMTDNGDNTATIDPSKLSGAIYELTYTYIKDNIPLSRIEQFTIEYVNPIWFVGFNKNTYCSNDNPIRLNGNIEEGVFYGSAVSGNIITGFYFVPNIAKIGVDTIYYSHTTSKGCSRKIYEVVTINEAPQIEFTALDTCVAAGSNDSTIFVNQTTSTDEITGWLWNFDDISSVVENTSTLENPKHLYTNSGRKYISLTVATIKNCVSTREIRFYFGDKPQADYHWSTECFKEGSPVMFIDKSSIDEGEISSYKWKFHVNDQIDSMDVKNPEYTFESYGDYKVGLEVITNYGCVDTFSNIFHLRPTFVLSEDNPYTEDFETGMNGWVSNKSVNSEANSWNFGLPTDGFIGAIGLNAWYTKIDNTKVEDSWISSPCFDFTGIKKPMIKMDMWRIFEQVRDGAVLQYRTNNEDNWYNIGDLDDGINWYNKYSVEGKPGGQSIGWSDLKDTKWIEARHKLDNLVGLTDVQFRIAYGSNGTGKTNKGVAIDNIGIWKRNKIVLLEHFTNSSDTLCKDANEIVKSAIAEYNGDVVDIQYHTAFPGFDPFNLDNPTTVDARTFYYGLLEVPYTYLDGGYISIYRYDYKSDPLNTNDINLQSLNDPIFRIELNTEITGNSINVSATLIARKAISPRELTLHTVIIEREITGVEGTNGEKLFRNVVKAMLPNAAGTYIYKSWTAGSTELINYSWNFSNVFDVDELRVVVFVQDETTKEIYQAAVDKFDFVNATANELTLNREFKCMVYPNPVSGYAYVRFNQPLTSDLKLDIFDNMGRLLESKMIKPWTEELLIDTFGYQEGIYFIRISNGMNINEILKIIVIK